MYSIDLNFGRTRQVDAYHGMTTSDFDIIAYKDFGVDFSIGNDGDHATDFEKKRNVNYYFNLWNDSLRHGAKVGSEPCFTSFMCAVARGDC